MKQIIPFSKKVEFDTHIYEITSISLENTLHVSNKETIAGDFILSGEYRMNDITLNTEPFNYNIPFSIELDDKYNTNNVRIDIDDFYYDIVDDNSLQVNIDVLIDGLEIIEGGDDDMGEELKKVKEDEDAEDYLRDEEVIDLFKQVNTKGIPLEVQETPKQETMKELKPIFDTFDEKNETYATYHVHIVREDDNIDSICLKYNVSKDELSNYNDITEIKLGDKIIVPAYKIEKNK